MEQAGPQVQPPAGARARARVAALLLLLRWRLRVHPLGDLFRALKAELGGEEVEGDGRGPVRSEHRLGGRGGGAGGVGGQIFNDNNTVIVIVSRLETLHNSWLRCITRDEIL